MSIFMRRRVLPAILLVTLAGCASFSDDHGFSQVREIAQQRLGKEVSWTHTEAERVELQQTIAQLPQKSLSVDDAVQVALLNNRGLQAAYEELGIAEANLVQAGRLSNPGFSFSHTRDGGNIKIERSFSLAIMQLLTLPVTAKIEQRQFQQTKLTVANQVLQVAAATRNAYYQSVAASQSIGYQEQVESAAAAGSELATKMAQAGNFNQLQLAREQSFHGDAVTQLTRARQQAAAARERLTRLMGLSGSQLAFQLPQRLPDLPGERPTLQDAESQAVAQRLDIAAAKLEVEGLQSSLGLSRATRFIDVMELAYLHNSEPDNPHETGYRISIEIPLFDWGSARIAKAEAIYMQAANRLADTALNAQSQVREAYLGYQSAYALARHYRDQVLPLRKRVSEEYLLRYNGMLASVFELLADARDQATAVNAAIDADRDFWIADSELQLALGGPVNKAVNTPAGTPLPASGEQP